MAKKEPISEEDRLLLLKQLANLIACCPVRDCLEDLHAAGKITEEEMGPLMKEMKNEIMLTLASTIGVPVFGIHVPEVFREQIERRNTLEWMDHGQIPGEWDEFDEYLKRLREYEKTGNIELLKPRDKKS